MGKNYVMGFPIKIKLCKEVLYDYIYWYSIPNTRFFQKDGSPYDQSG